MKPVIAITMGDPTGIGPEIIAGAWADTGLHDGCRAVVLGHPVLMARAAELIGAPLRVQTLERSQLVDGTSWNSTVNCLPCIDCTSNEVLALRPAAVDPRGGQAAYDAVTHGCRLALNGQIDALVTAPLNKAALVAAGHHYPGHTELLAELCEVPEVAMMLYLGPATGAGGAAGLGVVHVTLHTALRNVFDQLTSDRIVRSIHLADRIMAALLAAEGVQTAPRIGVCALNPHAGEQGLFGNEEQTIIRPSVSRAAGAGARVDGPMPADTLLGRAAAGQFDAVVAMYHDQGHIALKLLDMYRAVNITLGLPVIRTSVAHGTAFDLAWQGLASADGMVEAVRAATQLVAVRDSLVWT